MCTLVLLQSLKPSKKKRSANLVVKEVEEIHNLRNKEREKRRAASISTLVRVPAGMVRNAASLMIVLKEIQNLEGKARVLLIRSKNKV
jgi:hypothetical protein